MSGGQKKPVMTRTPRGKKPQYFSDPAIDKLLSMVLTLASELSVARERLDTVERLIEKHGLFDQEAIDSVIHDATAQQQRDSARAEFLDRVLRAVQMDLEQTVDKDMARGFEELIREVT